MLKNGHIRFDGARSAISCVVRNMSPAGALILVSTVSGIPSEFKLDIEGQRSRDCFVKWRDNFKLGVEFFPTQTFSRGYAERSEVEHS